MEGNLTDYIKATGTYSLLVLRDKKPVFTYGDIHDIFNIASIRKTCLSALFGIQVERDVINLSSTLEQLGIDDTPPLLPDERQATIDDLLKLRSGIYHDANYETAAMREIKPKRGSHPHGTFWYYNNWDANALGTIYNKLTSSDLFKDFETFVAKPLGMTDFSLAKCEYKEPDSDSQHRAYIMRMTVNDLAKFVQLYLNGGLWEGNQIVPKMWVKESLATYSVTDTGDGFGYMWNTTVGGKLYGLEVDKNAFGYSGFPGHYIVGMPAENIVIVCERDMELEGERRTLAPKDFGQLAQKVLATI